MANRPHLQAIDALVDLLRRPEPEVRLSASLAILDHAAPACPFCTYEPPSKAQLSVHLDECTGRSGYREFG